MCFLAPVLRESSEKKFIWQPLICNKEWQCALLWPNNFYWNHPVFLLCGSMSTECFCVYVMQIYWNWMLSALTALFLLPTQMLVATNRKGLLLNNLCFKVIEKVRIVLSWKVKLQKQVKHLTCFQASQLRYWNLPATKCVRPFDCVKPKSTNFPICNKYCWNFRTTRSHEQKVPSSSPTCASVLRWPLNANFHRLCLMLCAPLDWQYAELPSPASDAVLCTVLVRKMWVI